MDARDDLERLKAERDAADREYNEALTRLDRAVQRLPDDFPQPPPGADEHQVASLNTLWKIDAPPPSGGMRGWLLAAIRRAVAPLFEQQQVFNSAVVDHINRNVPIERQTRESIASTLTVLRDQLHELVGFQSRLVVFLQQITPFVDTRDRDVAGLLRGLSGAINAVSDELLKRADAMSARDRRHEIRVADVEARLSDLQARVEELRRLLGTDVAGRT